ncbi:hypothetical protein SH2C18_39380 [Clostridium sediminicola]|uniref:DUF1801 domain-containing protein n=1 Tax=Clostridium sediminicola TaxID=3114879 RepID=UPI0031F2080B
MAELKTKKNDKNSMEFLLSVEHKTRREDALVLLDIMKEITKEEPVMWGSSIVGFGTMEYENTTGINEWMMIGFSPRKQNLALYIMNGFKKYDDLLSKLGKHKIGKSCLYINKLDDIDLEVLKEIIKDSIEHIKSKKPIEY